eukprot:3943230-Pyramimonas_sp.AAC.1
MCIRDSVRGAPTCGGAAMRAAPLGPQAEIPMGPRSVRGVFQNGAAPPCGLGPSAEVSYVDNGQNPSTHNLLMQEEIYRV